jgi:hypothetical protein
MILFRADDPCFDARKQRQEATPPLRIIFPTHAFFNKDVVSAAASVLSEGLPR